MARARMRLFCFAHAGGSAVAFRTWADELHGYIDVRAIEQPGRGGRSDEAPFTSLPPLVAAACDRIRPYLDAPYALFGHSMGALVAFEVARLLRRADGSEPVLLAVASHRAPHLPARGPAIHNLPTERLLDEVEQLDGTHPAVLASADFMEIWLPIFRADLTVCETYSHAPEDPLDCAISAFGSLDDRKVTREELEAWQSQTDSAFRLRILPGNHFTLLRHPGLLRALSTDLRTAAMAFQQ